MEQEPMSGDPGPSAGARAEGPVSVWAARPGRALVAALLIALVVIAVLAIGSVLVRLQLIVVPVVVALLLASAIHPLVDILRRRNVPTLAAVWLSLLAGIALIGGLGWAVVHSITSQWSQISVNSDIGFGRIERQLAATLPFTEDDLRRARESAVESFFGGFSVGDALGALSMLANAFTAVLLTIVVLFFFLKDGRSMWIFFTRPLTGRTLERTQHTGDQVIVTLGGYLRGTTVIALIDATGIGLAMFFLGVPFALPLTMIIFLGGFVPVIGATVTGIFAVLVAYVTSGAGTAIAVGVAVVVVQQTEGNLLQPLIMGRAVKLHPVVILLALGAGALLGGVIGAVLAVPATAVSWAAVKAWNEKPGRGAHPVEPGTPH
ncbi:AI-2E family transporter [Arthrobacter agilis]|uniref:AI-2E family transporter n=1 Tax=Arthrobacter agilis TaxID=37921 RepID=UPI000B34EFE5|nr:AI-2E family transporter [Arthrobacter agilis]OUM42136.1 hypothetical protein B8W74_08435 [Arthrobacter agilis]PPB45481.1 AI-2E family transporter [Arthrobacter agilis]TPV26543.1 AI-2E family transporter [Arthrobacter agilis]